MADNTVFITGAAEGAFAEALNGIPPWATQKTAEDIEKALNKLLGVQSKALAQAIKCCKGAGGDNTGDSKKVNDELDKLARNLRRANEEDAKRKKRDKDEEREDNAKLNRGKKQKAIDELVQRGFTALSGVGSKILGIQKQYFETSQDLFKSGVNLLSGNNETTSSMMSLNQIVTLTGLRLETFQKVVEKYNSSVNAVGVGKFAKTLSLTSTRLIALGYSSEQQAELLGTLVESESSYMDIRGKSQEQLADDAERLGRQMTRLSILTGQSAAQLQENLKSLAKNTDSTVVASVYGEEAANRLNIFASSFKDADIGALFQKLGAATQPAITKTFQALAQAGQAPLAEEFTRIAVAARDGAISSEQAQKQTSDLAQKINSTTLQSLALLADKGVEGASETLSVITKLRAQGNTTSKATEQQVDAAIEAQASLSRFSTALEKTMSLSQAAFPLLESQVNLASAALETFNSAVTSATNLVEADTRSWLGVGLQAIAVVGGIIAVFGKVKDVVGLIGDALGTRSKSIDTSGKALGNSIGRLGSALGFLARGAGVVGAAFAGYEIGDKIVNPLIDGFLSRISGKDTTLGGSIYDLFNDESKILNTQPPVSKAPKPSTITSPSAVPPTVDKESPAATPTVASATKAATAPTPATNDINSVLAYQSIILSQILESSQNLVSVNRDILKYTKVHS